MLGWLRQRSELRHIGQQLYDGIVAQGRSEAFYRDLGVPDTMEGRYEMIALHLFLLRERLKSEGVAGQRLGQILLEHLIADMDDALRQIGYDMGVPRRVKKAAAGFGERAEAYGAALAGPVATDGADPLAEVLARHVLAGAADAAPAGAAQQLAAYVRQSSRMLAGLGSEALLGGQVAFPDPDPGRVQGR